MSGAFSGSELNLRLNRTRRAVHCRADLEYLNGDICCLNCPAGSHMTSPCSRAGEQGQCEECRDGTFTEHSNGLKQCLTCAQCRPDQEMVQPCASTHNTECRCKLGGFCSPDQACEVCRKCSGCGKDELVVRNCTPTNNTECKKGSPPDSGQDSVTLYVTLGLVLLAVVIFALGYVCRKRQKPADSGSCQPNGLKSGFSGTEKTNGPSPLCSVLSWTLVRPNSLPADVEEQRNLCEIYGSATNSEANLINPPFSAIADAAPLPPCATILTSFNCRADEPDFNVIPVNGEESLRSCFEFFEELDVHYHSRFFRHLGLSDNLIKSKESVLYVDRVHELLNIWLERQGREASLKDLLKALMNLNQRRTAEIIVERAVETGYYIKSQ